MFAGTIHQTDVTVRLLVQRFTGSAIFIERHDGPALQVGTQAYYIIDQLTPPKTIYAKLNGDLTMPYK
jgi:hypothetical protein